MLEAAMLGAARRRISVFRFHHARIATLSDLGSSAQDDYPELSTMQQIERRGSEIWRAHRMARIRGSLVRRFGRSQHPMSLSSAVAALFSEPIDL